MRPCHTLMAMSADRPTAVDVVVPTYNNLDELRRCLDSLALQQGGTFRTLVCVDGSTDGTLEFLESAPSPFPIVVLAHEDGRNHGRSAARNLALTALEAPMVLFLDSDMWLRPDALANHVRLLVHRDCASVGDVQYLNAVDNPWARYLGTRGKNKHAAGSRIRPLDFVTANSALRTERLLSTGGFDTSLDGYGGEDTEMGLRLAEGGLQFVFNEAAVAETWETKSVEQGLTELRRYAASNLRAIRKRHPNAPAPFWIDRAESTRLRDRLFRLMLNPLTDICVDLAMRIAPGSIRMRLLNYKVIRAVFTGYGEGTR